MKHARKILSLLLALAMVFAMAAPAWAEDPEQTDNQDASTSVTGSITIDNAVVGQTYTVYRILYLESYNADAKTYSYKATTVWSSFINGASIKGTYVNVDAQGYVTWVAKADAAAFAKLAQAYAKTNNISNEGYSTATAAEGSTETTTTVTFSNLALGYYLVDSTLGTLCFLDTTNPSVTISEKNAAPSNEKEVEEDSKTGTDNDNRWGSVNDADIGQIVNFKSTITLPKGSENIVFHDTMSNGLTLDSKSIKVYTDENMTTELDNTNYSVITTDLTDGCTFEVSFAKTYLDSLTADSTTVYVKYAATVNENAVVGNSGNTNTSKVSYGDTSNTKTTPDSTTTTYTWSFDVLKYANGDKNKVLKDAKFVLLSTDKTKVAIIMNGKLTEWANVPTAGQDGTFTWQENTTLTTDDNGKIAIAGLDADTYYLREIAAPAGYNKLADDVKVEIAPTTNTATDGSKTLSLTAVIVEIENKSGTELPSTGGAGTALFYIVGGILAVGAVVLLVTKRRMRNEDE